MDKAITTGDDQSGDATATGLGDGGGDRLGGRGTEIDDVVATSL